MRAATRFLRAWVVALLVLGSGLGARTALADALGFYLGGGVGWSTVHDDSFSDLGLTVEHHPTGWTALLGLRPIPFIGGEIQYVDFGSGSASSGAFEQTIHQHGPAAFVNLYLPLPFIDLFAKAGIASTETSSTERATGPVVCPLSTPNCGYSSSSGSVSKAAYGGGVQLKFGHFAVRGEYVRFEAQSGHPQLAALEALWRF